MPMHDLKNLYRLKTIAEHYRGQKGRGVSKRYITDLLQPYIVEADTIRFVDITKLPKKIRDKIDL